MTHLQIEYFLSVATTKSISRTASELFVSPPAVSKQISLMEQELDLKLFTRGTQGMELTLRARSYSATTLTRKSRSSEHYSGPATSPHIEAALCI